MMQCIKNGSSLGEFRPHVVSAFLPVERRILTAPLWHDSNSVALNELNWHLTCALVPWRFTAEVIT